MKHLLALTILAACTLCASCGRGYKTNSSAYHTRSYSTYRTSSYRHREHRSHTGTGGSLHHHHHHDGDQGKGRR